MHALPHPLIVLPFVALLALIALAPLFFADWWGKHYAKVALALALVTLTYYLGVMGATESVAHTALEYFSFISLIGSLYIVSGGIRLVVRGEATPVENVCFLLAGAVLANLLGTTGAAMLLIRPWIRMNRYRITSHHIVFFIFIVANVGGCLTPIGDPPLFAGYLKGVPFWWVAEHCWPIWAVGVGVLLIMFFVVDTVNYRRAPKEVREQLAEPRDTFHVDGLHNLVFLAVILAAVFIQEPHFVREIMMLAAAAGSYYTTKKHIHQANHFNFHPIEEVAILFVGIFATMMPALDLLEHYATRLGDPTAGFFFWSSGILSSMLDNMPTYLCFLKAIFGAFVDAATVEQVQHLIANGGADLAAAGDLVRNTFAALQQYHPADLAARQVSVDEIEVAFLIGNLKFNSYLTALSAGAVFFGANTYIGNGPNFMVKAIADHQRVRTPTFLGYILKFTLPVMLPMLLIVWGLFFRAA